ncbi:ABC transporter ATP-binding protein [Chitinophaga horti]|uniref:ABC transporter ATP-binding protein n=1 Tax=Chitinophaga horti TaxID=2920382 RepID=A0ABY6J0D6_9BACT|nr:ABC transporter ATP-binding protein [Chitinophaga horti]UYQ92107.1 ABC transporter ATP-binding protein [Chitinophaga horti]
MISLNRLSFYYRKGNPVLEDVTLQLAPGRIYGLLGRNGAGKSSLMHALCGLLFPKAGEVQVLGFKPGERKPAFLQQVFILPETFQVPNITVDQLIAVDAAFYPAFDKQAFYQYLEQFEVPADAHLSSLSFGQAKKVMISFALATRVKLLLLDEPTNGLDIPSKRQFRKVIAGTLQDDQLMIMSTHQVKDLDNLIDHIIVLDEHRILFNASVDEISERLLFSQQMTLTGDVKPIYHEGSLKGYITITPNNTSVPSSIDMEMFFNGLMSEKQQMLALFNH